MDDGDWERRVEACWIWIRSSDPSSEQLLEAIDALAAEREPDDPAALYERGSARDSAGRASEAEPLYRAALSSAALDAKRRPQAIIQLASTLRILGRLDESEELLRAELERCTRFPTAHALPDETRATLALTLLARGNAIEAALLALVALAPHLSRYSRSVLANAEEIGRDGLDSWKSGPI
jgi:tetratricopeptide (TPR) repeat protein